MQKIVFYQKPTFLWVHFNLGRCILYQKSKTKIFYQTSEVKYRAGKIRIIIRLLSENYSKKFDIFQVQNSARVAMSYTLPLTWVQREFFWLASGKEFTSVEIRELFEIGHSKKVIFSDNCLYLFNPLTKIAQISNLEFTFDLDYDSIKKIEKIRISEKFSG